MRRRRCPALQVEQLRDFSLLLLHPSAWNDVNVIPVETHLRYKEVPASVCPLDIGKRGVCFYDCVDL